MFGSCRGLLLEQTFIFQCITAPKFKYRGHVRKKETGKQVRPQRKRK